MAYPLLCASRSIHDRLVLGRFVTFVKVLGGVLHKLGYFCCTLACAGYSLSDGLPLVDRLPLIACGGAGATPYILPLHRDASALEVVLDAFDLERPVVTDPCVKRQVDDFLELVK